MIERKAFLERYFIIDFQTKRCLILTAKHNWVDYRTIEFLEVDSVSRAELDCWSKEHELVNKFKFIVKTKVRSYELFARTDKERSIWMENFCRIIDYNHGFGCDFQKPSQTFKELVPQGRVSTKCFWNKK